MVHFKAVTAKELSSASVHQSTVEAEYLVLGVKSIGPFGMKTQSKGKQKQTGKIFVLQAEIESYRLNHDLQGLFVLLFRKHLPIQKTPNESSASLTKQNK